MGAVENIANFDIRYVTERLDELPILPAIVYELSRVINNPMSSTSEVESIMSKDNGMTMKVLRLANSAYYAIPGGVTNLKRAVAFIGYDAIYQLVLSASIMKALDAKASVNFDPKQFWRHSLGVAMVAETVAKATGHSNPSDLFTCGLVHDMGKIALFMIVPEAFARTLAFAKERNLTVIEAEQALRVPTHTEVGRELSLKWRLPAVFQSTISFHHQRDAGRRGGLTADLSLMVDIVFLANLLVHALQFGHSGHDKVSGVPKEILERLGLSQEHLKDIILKVRVSIADAENFLTIIGA